MRVLFYLPVVTPWWFSNVVIGLIRTLASEHEVHVIVPPFWHGTGITQHEAHHIEALPDVFWHLLNGPNHPRLRTDASQEDELIEFVEAIAPDLTLCRSADLKTPARFPGCVRYLMEGGAPPFQLQSTSLALKTELFDHGFTPMFEPEVEARLDAIGQELWEATHARLRLPSREVFFQDAGIDPASRIIGLPLEYEHPENFFHQHHAFADNVEMLRTAARDMGKEATLLVTHHPLTEQHGDVSRANAAIKELGQQVKLLPRSYLPGEAGPVGPYNVTQAMALHCDAMVVGNSKSWAICAAFGTPIARLSDAPTAPWVNACKDVARLMSNLDAGTACAPDRRAAKRWFAHHILNRVFDAQAPDLTAHDIIGRAFAVSDPELWEKSLARYRVLNPNLEPALEAT